MHVQRKLNPLRSLKCGREVQQEKLLNEEEFIWIISTTVSVVY
jgi:hypothetical protein